MPDHPDEAVRSLHGERAAEIIDKWFADHIHGSIIARHVDCYNHLHDALGELKKRLSTRQD